MTLLDESEIQCPYCWEHFSILVDPSEGEDQAFVYDCEVCCRPIDVIVSVQDECVNIRTKQGGSL